MHGSSHGLTLLRYLDARVRRDRAPPGFRGCICIGVRAALWWVVELSSHATTAFAAERPTRFDVAVGLDDAAAAALLGLPITGERMELVCGDRALLSRFVQRYLRDISPLAVRLGAAASGGSR